MADLTALEIIQYIDPSRLDYQDCETKYSVYKHTTPCGKVYIGMTGNDPQDRWDSGHGYRKHKYFWNAIQKYGWKNIKHEVLYEGLTKDLAYEMEIQLIIEYKSTDKHFGYNLSIGGKGGSTGTILSQETRLKMSKSRTGTKHPMYGKHHTKATKEKLSEKLSGENHPQFGTHRSDKTKEKLRKANSGPKHPMFGTHHTEEHKRKISTASPLQKPSEASRQTGINKVHISGCCRKEKHRKTSGGYHWEFIREVEDARIRY